MARVACRLLLRLVVTLFLISAAIFVGLRVVPGDPALTLLGPQATNAELEAARQAMGLDQPIFTQYTRFMRDVFRGDLGESLFFRYPVLDLVLERVPATMELAIVTIILVIAVGVPVGIMSATRQGSAFDILMRFVVYLGQATANYWLGIMLILVFAVKLDLFPSFGRSGWESMVLPVVALGVPLIARVVRFTRTGMLDVLHMDYVRTARAKGLHEFKVAAKHAFRNVLIPLVTDTGLNFAWLLGGSVIVETVFAWPGIGSLTVNAVRTRDYPVVQGSIIVFSILFLTINVIIDLCYAWLNPKIKYQ